MSRPLSAPAVGTLLVLATLAAYAGLWPAGYLTGDTAATLDAPAVREPGGLWQLWTAPQRWLTEPPLAISSHWLVATLGGPGPRAAHAASVLLHLLAAIGLWRLLVRLGSRGAALGAAWFAVHPLTMEAVAWVTARSHPLGLAIGTAAALLAVRWLDTRHRGHAVLATALWLAACLSHPALVVLPWLLPLVAWWRTGAVAPPVRRAGFLLGGLATTALAVAVAWQPSAGSIAARSLGESVRAVANHAWHGVAGTVWPFARAGHYPAAATAGWWELTAAAALGLAVVGCFGWRRRLGRGPLTALLASLVLLLPQALAIALPPLPQAAVADRLHYFSLAALLAALAAAATQALDRLPGLAKPTVVALSTLVLAGSTGWQSTAYRDSETRWRRTLAVAPDSTLAMTNLGSLALERGEPRAAKQWFEQSLAIAPDQADAIANLGVIAHRDGDLATAKRHYLRALDLQPELVTAMHNLAVLQLGSDEANEAAGLLEVALAIDPNYFDARVTLAQALHRLQRWAELRPHAEWVLARRPGARPTRSQLVEALLGLEQDGLAAGHAAFLLRAEPTDGNARRLLATALARLVAKGPAEGAGRRALQGCQQGSVDATAVLPLVAAELRRRGAAQHAADVAAQPVGR